MNTTRICPLLFLPPAFAATAIAIVRFFSRRRKKRMMLNRDIVY